MGMYVIGSCRGGEFSYIGADYPGGELSYSGELSWWEVVLVGPGVKSWRGVVFGELSWWGVVLVGSRSVGFFRVGVVQ